MLQISDELKYSLNLPLPPFYSLRQNPTLSFQVPEFFGYESPSTRWILAMLTNKSSLKRLLKCGKYNEDIFCRYYQIPDRPVDIMGFDYPLENPAYHQQCVLYLTPLSLALYLKQPYAVEMLLSLKDDEGRRLVHPSEPCFVQKVYRKGEKRMTNELANSFPIIIAIRRNFYEGVALLSEFGYTPQKQFSVLNRLPYRESVTLYRDVVDYLTELLRKRPGLNVTKFIRIITDPSIGLTTFDFFVFDLELTGRQKWDYVSIFRRVCRVGLTIKFFIEESATQLINILEQIQMMGYFGGLNQMRIYYNGTPPEHFEKMLSERTIKELQDKRISIVMDKIPTIIKATRDDLFKMDEKELDTRLKYDYQACIGMLFLWYQKCLYQERTSQYAKLTNLMSRVIVDTNIVTHFFTQNNAELAKTFSEWSQDVIKESTVADFRIRMQDYILFTDQMCINFINTFGEIPNKMIKAPLLPNRHPEDSPIVRELLYVSKASLHVNTNNENHNQSNTCIFNMMDDNDNLMYKLIPANHAKNYSLELTSNLQNINIRSCFSNSSLYEDKNLEDDFLGDTIEPKTEIIQSHVKLANDCDNDCDETINEDECFRDFIEMLPPKPAHKAKSSSMSNKFHKKVKLSRAKSHQESPHKIKQTGFNTNCHNSAAESESNKLRNKLKQIVNTNERYKDIKITDSNQNHDFMTSEEFPLRYLLEDIEKFDSGSFIMQNIQSKNITKMDNLYNNLTAAAIIHVMQDLATKTNFSKSTNLNASLYQVFHNNK